MFVFTGTDQNKKQSNRFALLAPCGVSDCFPIPDTGLRGFRRGGAEEEQTVRLGVSVSPFKSVKSSVSSFFPSSPMNKARAKGNTYIWVLVS